MVLLCGRLTWQTGWSGNATLVHQWVNPFISRQNNQGFYAEPDVQVEIVIGRRFQTWNWNLQPYAAKDGKTYTVQFFGKHGILTLSPQGISIWNRFTYMLLWNCGNMLNIQFTNWFIHNFGLRPQGLQFNVLPICEWLTKTSDMSTKQNIIRHIGRTIDSTKCMITMGVHVIIESAALVQYYVNKDRLTPAAPQIMSSVHSHIHSGYIDS